MCLSKVPAAAACFLSYKLYLRRVIYENGITFLWSLFSSFILVHSACLILNEIVMDPFTNSVSEISVQIVVS